MHTSTPHRRGSIYRNADRGQASRAVSKKNSVAILGFGQEGQSLLRYLERDSAYRGSKIWVLDRDPSVRSRINPRRAKKIRWQLGPDYLKNLDSFSMIFRSPGIPYLLPELTRARRRGIKIESTTRLFFKLFEDKDQPQFIGITGTKGKGTTSTLIAAILKKAKYQVVLAGNIGKPVLDLVPQAARADFVVLELSSFQLQDLSSSPHIAVVLDIFPDHLDAHRTLGEYLAAKANVAAHQHPGDAAFFFTNDVQSKKIAAAGRGRKIGVTPKEPSLKKNFEMAAAVARFLRVPDSVISKTINSFRGLEHRLELVRKKSRIYFYNDSAATNPEATVAAIRTVHFPLVLIAGGKDKKLNYRPLANAIRESPHVRSVILIGENRKKIKTAIGKIKELTVAEAPSLGRAVKLAAGIAKELAATSRRGSAVLFSPAAASFDMFESYADRGKQFKKIVKSLR